MELMKLTASGRNYQVLALCECAKWPSSMPPLVFRSVQIAGRRDLSLAAMTLEANDQADLEKLLADLYLPLSLAKFSQLKSSCESVGLSVQWPRLADLSGYRWSDDFVRALDTLSRVSTTFLDWCAEKDIGARDLAPLRAVKCIESLNSHLEHLVKWNPSRSEGVKAIEFAVDLFLMGKPIDTTFQSAPNFGELYRELQKLRYPETTHRQLLAESKLKELPWPKRSQVRVARVGDQSGVEIKFFIQSAEDLRKQVENFALVSREMMAQESEERFQ